jgi:hypothetical protein
MKRISTLVLSLVVFTAALSLAQGPPKMTPAPELKKLNYFAGTWKATGELKPGPMGPGGKYTTTDHNVWELGHFFLVSHSTTTGVMGNLAEVSYFGYSAPDKAYTYDAFNSMGEAEHFKGTVEGDTWTWTSTGKMGEQTMKQRFTLTIASPTSYNFKFEIAPEGGGDYTTVVDGKATKVTAAKAAGTAAKK